MSLLLLISAVLTGQSCPAKASAAAAAAYTQLDYAGAARAVEGLEQCLDGSAEELALALRWRAQALFGLDRPNDAIDAFVLLATILPTYNLDPMLSPRLHELYRAARVRVLQGRFVYARLKPPRAGELEVEVFGPDDSYDEVVVQTRPGPSVSAARAGAVWRAPRPPEARAARVLLRAKGKPVLVGPEVTFPVLTPAARDAPLAATATATSAAPSKGPWLWVGLGAGAVVVAAIAIGVGVGVGSGQRGRVLGTLGGVDLP